MNNEAECGDHERCCTGLRPAKTPSPSNPRHPHFRQIEVDTWFSAFHRLSPHRAPHQLQAAIGDSCGDDVGLRCRFSLMVRCEEPGCRRLHVISAGEVRSVPSLPATPLRLGTGGGVPRASQYLLQCSCPSVRQGLRALPSFGLSSAICTTLSWNVFFVIAHSPFWSDPRRIFPPCNPATFSVT